MLQNAAYFLQYETGKVYKRPNTTLAYRSRTMENKVTLAKH